MSHVGIRFSDCELTVARLELRRADKIVGMEPQVFDVPADLLRHRERVVAEDGTPRHARRGHRTSRRMRLLALPLDSVPVTATEPISAVLRTWVHPSACLSRPTISITRSGSISRGIRCAAIPDQCGVRVGHLTPDEIHHDLPGGRDLLVDSSLEPPAQLRRHRVEREVQPAFAGLHVAAGHRDAVVRPDHLAKVTSQRTCSAVCVRIVRCRRSQSSAPCTSAWGRAVVRRPASASSAGHRVSPG
jgi:hypothetical protein